MLAVSAGAQVALAASAYGLSAIAPAIQAHFDVDLVHTGAVLAAMMLGMVATNLAWGLATDRFGEGRVLLLGLGASALALFGAALTPGYYSLLGCLVLAGMTGTVAVPAGGRAVLRWFDAGERGAALGVRQMAVPLGAALAAMSLPGVLFTFGLAACLVELASMTAVAAVAAGIWMPSTTLRSPRPSPPGPSPLRDVRIWRVAGAGALMMAGQLSLVAYLTTFLTHARGLGLAPAAGLLAVLQITGAAGLVAVGRLSDRLGHRLGLLRLAAAASALGSIAVGIFVDVPLGPLLALLLGVGFVSVTSNGLNFTVTGEIAGPSRAGTAMGLQATLFASTGVAGQLLFAAIVDGVGWRWGYVFAGVVGLAAWCLLNPLVDQEREGWGAGSGVPLNAAGGGSDEA
ncbi:MAG: MFS transporter [Candidatus Dormibacteraceae bacterium]